MPVCTLDLKIQDERPDIALDLAEFVEWSARPGEKRREE
jgi:hypothetical protein